MKKVLKIFFLGPFLVQKVGGKMARKIKTDKYSTIIKPNLELIEKMARDNFTDEAIAEHFGIGKSTFSRYKKENVALRKALAKGKEICLAEVENHYFKMALGGQKYKEVKKIYNKDNELVKREVVEKVTLPNEKALNNILVNKGDWENKETTSNGFVINITRDDIEEVDENE